MLRLETFGGLGVRSDVDSAVVTQRRRLALLALLAVSGERGLSRDKVAAFLWPEGSVESTRRSLDQLVYGVRQEVGETTILGVNPLRLNPAVIESDLALFEQALSTNSLERAAALYRGPFLDGFFLANAPDFERWVESERARLAERFGLAIERLANTATARGDRAAAVAWWRRLAAHDPLRVPAALGLMRALAASGDRTAALSHAKVYERLVMHELDSAPDPAITKLAEELRRSADAVNISAVAPQVPPAASMVREEGRTGTVSVEPAPPSPSGSPRPARRVIGVLAVAGLCLVGLLAVPATSGRWKGQVATTVTEAEPARILLTPFHVVGADSSLRELGEGMVDLLAAEFTGEGGPVAVDSRMANNAWTRLATSSRDPSADDARKVARAVGADWALVGELMKLPGEQVRLAGRLLRASDETVHVLASVTGPRDSLSTLLDEFAGKVLAREAGIAEPRLGSLTTRSLPALRAYLAGRAERRRGHDGEAIEYFARALEFDSTFALAALDLVSTTGWLLRWAIVTPFDTGRRIATLLPGSNPARTAAEEARFDRALQIAWGERDKMSRRDKALLLALRGERYPRPGYAREVLASLERATWAAPDRAETRYAIGHLLLHQGPALGLTDSRERANAAFRTALALDSSYAAPIAGLLELAAFDGDSTALRRFGTLYLTRDSLSPVADYVRWRVAAGTGDEAGLRILRARFASLSTETLERIQVTSQVAGVALEDADRAMDEIVRRASDSYERWIALFNANILALNRGRPREAFRLLGRKRELEHTDEALWHNACLDETFGDGDPAAGADAVRALRASVSGRPDSSPSTLAMCLRLRGDTTGAGVVLDRLRRAGDDRAIVLDALRAEAARRPDAAALRVRVDSLALLGCCAGPKWIGLTAAGLHERAGDEAGALRSLRAGRWLFPPQYLSTYLREEGRLAARSGDRDGAIRAYRHYLALRSNPEPELRADTDRVRAELALLERGG